VGEVPAIRASYPTLQFGPAGISPYGTPL